MASIKDIGKLFVFVIGGLVAIIVGSFMIRGTMHMWTTIRKIQGIKRLKSKN